MKQHTTYIPYRQWKLRQRMVEKLYRWTHNGQIRTVVIGSREDFDQQIKEWQDWAKERHNSE